MDLRSIARPGPGQFICEQGALALLDEKLSIFKYPVMVTGVNSYAAFTRFYKGKLTLPILRYDGTCSHEDIERLCQSVPDKCDCLVAVGGGKLIDTAKAISNRLNIAFITIPTVLGTCAATTPLSIIYHPDHTIKCGEHYERAAHLCLADLDLLVDSPLRYLMGGIGDTLSKWYEADAAIAHLGNQVNGMIQAGLALAQVTRTILMTHTPHAIESIQNKTVTLAFRQVVEAIIGIGGAVGGFTGKAARVSGAHAIHDGMSLLPETHPFDHGIKVAYGILVQLAAEGKYESLAQLRQYFRQNGFSCSLAEFNVETDLIEKMSQIAQIAVSDKQSFRLAVPNCTCDQVVEAMKYVEAMKDEEV